MNGYNYQIIEKGHDVLSHAVKEEFNYGTFSARYGNIYTSRQLVQLIKRAYGELNPTEDIWQSEEVYIDPYRPNIQPNGFAGFNEFVEDRKQHFKAVKILFETLDVFIFTLGLTECWQHKDGMVFPLCPGVAGGDFDKEKHSLVNLSVSDVIDDLSEFLKILKSINPKAKVIFTISPVPLIATATKNHVLVSTTYSKAVLRVAAEEICAMFTNASYFPSYEIITGSFSSGRYFSDDLRGVTEAGVRHVMKVFFKNVAGSQDEIIGDELKGMKNNSLETSFLKKMKSIVDVICEEDLLDNTNN